MQKVLRHDGQQGARAAKQHGHQIERNGAHDHLPRADKPQARAQGLPGDGTASALRRDRYRHHGHAKAGRGEEQASHQKGGDRASHIEQPAHRRADDARGGPGGGIPGHRIGEVFLGDHIGGQRLRGRIGEGAARGDRHDAGIDETHIRRARHHQRQQAERPQRANREGAGHDLAAIVGIGEMAGEKRQHGGGKEGGQTGEAQRQRAVRHPIDIPANSHRLHGQSDAEQQARAAMKPEIAMREGRIACIFSASRHRGTPYKKGRKTRPFESWLCSSISAKTSTARSCARVH